MANTRQSTKRAKQEDRRRIRNSKVTSTTKTAVKKALTALKSTDLAQAKEAYRDAVAALAKAVNKGVFPKARASRKMSRLAKLVQKVKPEILSK